MLWTSTKAAISELLAQAGLIMKASARTLLGRLRRWPEVEYSRLLLIPPNLVQELSSVWSLLPPVESDPQAAVRKHVGNRAELYSFSWSGCTLMFRRP
jgi:hypothetical protein